MSNTGTSASIPVGLYESLLEKLVAVLRLTQQPDGVQTPQAKQALLMATNDFRSTLAQAKDVAVNLAGGELMIEDQDDVINMLETLKNRKRAQLAQFSARTLASTSSSADTRMEIDSMASTPFHD
ncbi:hypothetical protein BDQ12DRAFT_674399 [Crucibulum laeve]|uniref:Mediator complex subunit 9 n=1 Tax=Crucibulum laeve TaxID=68775 RepID=A0A5C3MEQ1_9AGAR|nr:hypothetical protein BDQ12DRAFT_674399 [Crucibulum laeve]